MDKDDRKPKGDHDKDNHKGHGHDLSLNQANGFQLASYTYLQDQDHDRDNQRHGGMRRDSHNYRHAAGHYMNTTEWRQQGQHFAVQYVINLGGDGGARLEATSLEDRNMPNNDRNTDPHGQILRYMHSGHDVIQRGTWGQDGDRVTIHLTDMEFGHKNRPKSETLRAHLQGSTLYVDNYDTDFYGARFNTAFTRS